MNSNRPLFIPVILGTVRVGRMSQHVARLMCGEIDKRAGVETELIDIAQMPLPISDAGEAIKNADFAARVRPRLNRHDQFATDICNIRTADFIEFPCRCKTYPLSDTPRNNASAIQWRIRRRRNAGISREPCVTATISMGGLRRGK